MSEVISSFRNFRTGSQVFSLFMSFLCVENYIGSVYVGGYCGVSKSGLCVFGKLCIHSVFL